METITINLWGGLLNNATGIPEGIRVRIVELHPTVDHGV